MSDEVTYCNAKIVDYPRIHEMWMESSGIGVTSKEDSEESISKFLEMNGRYCFSAFDDDKVIGMVLCGSDGRSARIYHLIVDPMYRRRGIGHELVGHA